MKKLSRLLPNWEKALNMTFIVFKNFSIEFLKRINSLSTFKNFPCLILRKKSFHKSMSSNVYNPNLASYYTIGSYSNYHQINNNINKSKTQYNVINNNNQFQPQPSYFQPIVYSPYDFYHYMNGSYSYPYVNYSQYPQAQCQPQLVNINQQNIAYNVLDNSESTENMSFCSNTNFNNQTAISNNSCSSNSNESCSSDLSDDDDDSFGSIFQPLSVLQEKQRKREQFNRLLNSNGYIYQFHNDYNSQILSTEKNKQFNEFEIGQKENNSIIENLNYNINDQIQQRNDLVEDKNESNLQHPPQPQELKEKVNDEVDENQKVFKPKTFKEIEDEEKKNNKSQFKESNKKNEVGKFNNKAYPSRSNSRKNNSFKRGRKIW